MPSPDDSYLRHQQQRWTRHDAHLWVRPDAARFLPPGMDAADLYPTLARKPDAAKTAAFEAELAAEIAAGYRLLAVLREQVAAIRAELKRRRELEAATPSIYRKKKSVTGTRYAIMSARRTTT